MLLSLSIRDIVLIERLDLDFAPAGLLGVLTGETGAGKSILLDALGLALGWRGRQRPRCARGADAGRGRRRFELPHGPSGARPARRARARRRRTS